MVGSLLAKIRQEHEAMSDYNLVVDRLVTKQSELKLSVE